jgi:hypothetical protein
MTIEEIKKILQPGTLIKCDMQTVRYLADVIADLVEKLEALKHGPVLCEDYPLLADTKLLKEAVLKIRGSNDS